MAKIRLEEMKHGTLVVPLSKNRETSKRLKERVCKVFRVHGEKAGDGKVRVHRDVFFAEVNNQYSTDIDHKFLRQHQPTGTYRSSHIVLPIIDGYIHHCAEQVRQYAGNNSWNPLALLGNFFSSR